VRVDTLTGRVQVVDMVAIQDQGIPLNRLALRSQINGGMIQALSFGLLEERVVDPELGLLLTDNLENYKIAGALEMPSMRSIIDDDDPRWAVTGSAEAPIIPGHSAIANAIFNACGARVRSTPFTPDKVLAALAARS
jgi:xanthine dehydrogenase YagR molybdenum-binding subunit